MREKSVNIFVMEGRELSNTLNKSKPDTEAASTGLLCFEARRCLSVKSAPTRRLPDDVNQTSNKGVIVIDVAMVVGVNNNVGLDTLSILRMRR